MLDQKAKQLAKSESDLKKKKSEFEKQRQEAISLLEATYAHKVAETEARLKVETKALQKKVTLAEKSIKEKLKSLQKQS